MRDIRQYASPNIEDRRGAAKPSLVILHYTGMQSGEAALARLAEPVSKVSAHYLVEEDGRIFQLVDEAKRAWHAGKGFWRGITDINSQSIGIEMVNPGHEFGYRAFPHMQMEAVCELCLDIKTRRALPADAFLGHSDVAPTRKEDPGELFDWKGLAASGIGIWPKTLPEDMRDITLIEAMNMLQRYGYAPVESADECVLSLLAFQRHFAPAALTGTLNEKTMRKLNALLRESGR